MSVRKVIVGVTIAVMFLEGCASSRRDVQQDDSLTPEEAENAQARDPESSRSQGSRESQRIEGTGSLFSQGNSEVQTAPQGTGEFQLGFTDTEIAQVVAAVLGDGLGVPYVVDPRVKGTMTLQASRPLTKEEVLVALETALRAQGAALIVRGGVYQIVPNAEAARRVAELRGAGRGGPGYGVYVVPLQYVSAGEMQKILQPFAPEGGVLRVDEQRNLLLLAGTAQEIDSLKNVVQTFDVDWMAGMSFGIYPLEYVDAKTLANELADILNKAGGPLDGLMRFVPLSRLNTLLVVTPQARYLREVEAWIKRLDLGVSTPGRRIYVYDVQNGKADDIAQSLNSILSISTDATSNSGRALGNGASGATRATGNGAGSLRQDMGASLAGDGSVAVAFDGSALKIVTNEENNSILILASPSEYQVVEAALRRLDVVPIQVLIEASIAEVTLTDDMRYGLQWAYQSDKGPMVLSESSSGAIGPQFPGFSYLYNIRSDIRAVLNAIESLTNVRVLSSPKLMVLNNREAQLQVGDQVPISTQSAVSTQDGSSPIVNSIQLRDTGVILRVTPRANKSGRVVLEVAQEVSDATKNSVSGIDSPTIAQRKISTTVSMQDGETVALGGLIRNAATGGGSGIPYLRKIPLLGQAFGSTNRNSRRTELVVLITPHVVRSDREMGAAMEDLQSQFRGLRKLLPEWNESGRSPTNGSGSNVKPPSP